MPLSRLDAVGRSFERLALSVAFVASAGCGPSQPTTLKSAASAGVILEIGNSLGVDTIVLEEVTPDQESDCPTLPHVKATDDGVTMPQELAGEWVSAAPVCPTGTCGTGCFSNATWTLSNGTHADEPITTFVLSDSSATWTVGVAHLYAPRTLQLSSATPVASPGTLSLTWSVPSDVVNPQDDLSNAAGFGLVDGGPVTLSNGMVWSTAAIQYANGIVSISLPAGVPSGSYVVQVDPFALALVTTCTGPSSCAAATSQLTLSPVTFTVQ
jgi:hypothetical protein